MTISPYQKYVLSIGAASLVSLLIGWQLGQRDVQIQRASGSFLPTISFQKSQPADLSQVDMTQFWNVWRIVTSKYVEKDKISAQKLVEGATQGMVSALDDPYSVYLTQQQNQDSKDQLGGTFEGVGMELGFNEQKQLVVVSPLSESPAEKAGIRAGDKIWKIEDKETPGISLAEAVQQIRGKKGTKVNLKIQRDNGDLFDVAIVRDTIFIKSVEVKLLENDSIAHVKVNRFGDTTKTEWDNAVATIQAKNIKKLVLDVRNDPGGYLDTAVYINSDFLTGTVLQQEDYAGNRKKYTATHSPRLADRKVIALINKGSASAAEIVSGALQDRGFAKLVGVNSFGKGTIQEVVDLQAGSGLHITTAKWLLPSGTWIHKKGLKPDYEVKMSEEDITSKRDPQLDKAVELLK